MSSNDYGPVPDEYRSYSGLREQILANARVVFRKSNFGTLEESKNIEIILHYARGLYSASVVGGPDDEVFITSYGYEYETAVMALERILNESSIQVEKVMAGGWSLQKLKANGILLHDNIDHPDQSTQPATGGVSVKIYNNVFPYGPFPGGNVTSSSAKTLSLAPQSSQPKKRKYEDDVSTIDDESDFDSPDVAKSLPAAKVVPKNQPLDDKTWEKIERLARLKLEAGREGQSDSVNSKTSRESAAILKSGAIDIATLEAELTEEQRKVAEKLRLFAASHDHDDRPMDGAVPILGDGEGKGQAQKKRKRAK